MLFSGLPLLLVATAAVMSGGYLGATSLTEAASEAPPLRQLPSGALLVAYAPQCNTSVIVDAARRGVNVIIWFSINLEVQADGKPVITNGPNPACVAETAAELRRMGLETTHMISIGGWDAPHPNTTLDGREWWVYWKEWNRGLAKPELGFYGYAGIDWDLEGNDAMTSPWNHFTVECMEVVGIFSQEAKRDGYLVSLVPPESYLDVTTSGFDRWLNHSYPEWHHDFVYHGKNIYALWLAKYGRTERSLASIAAYETTSFVISANDHAQQEIVPTFDFVSLQWYESWTHAGYYIDSQGVPAASYLSWVVQAMERGWMVDFSSDPALNFTSREVSVPAWQLVVGLSRGSSQDPAQAGRSLFVWPRDVKAAFDMMPADARPRGVMYWNINNDQGTVNGTNATCDFAREFNKFLHTRG